MHSTFLHSGIILIAFVTYYLFSYWAERKILNPIRQVTLTRFIGTLLFCMAALSYFELEMLTVDQSALPVMISLTLSLSALAVVVNAVRKKSNADIGTYPMMRISDWNIRVLMLNSVTWMIYLLPYEFLMRGAFLHQLISSFDLWIAFVINAFVYALVHAPQGRRETLISFPFGILLCWVSYITGNFWSAYFIHLALAISNDIFSIRDNPSMKFSTLPTHQLWHSIKRTSH